MSVQNLGLKAYTSALKNFAKAEQNINSKVKTSSVQDSGKNSFTDVLNTSLEKVNELQEDRTKMVTSFASGENQNVHELMIAMQKASLAMNMTSAVRNKVMEAYKELSRLQF